MTSMLTSKRIAAFCMLGLLTAGILGGCNKKDENLIADYNSKKAAADKLISDVNTAMTNMKADHAAWLAKLDDAAKNPKADTAKISGFRAAIQKCDADCMAPMALIDSVKAYENAPTDDMDKLRAANASLSSNVDALTSKSKDVTDEHSKLGTDVQTYLTSLNGPPVTDESKENEEHSGKKAPAEKHTTGLAPRQSAAPVMKK